MSKKIWILLLVLVFVGGFFAYRNFWGNDPTKIVYKEIKVEKGPLNVSVLSTGVVQPENRLEIKPPVAGRVEKIMVEEGDRVHKGQILAWMSSVERAALVDAARAKGKEELQRWEDMYKATPVIAPIDGMIILRNVQSGQTFSTSDAVMVMSNRLTVKAQVDETDISKIQLRQKADVVLDAYPGKTLLGTVDKIAFDAKTVNSVTTYVVDVLPDEVPPFMLSGMTSNVTFHVAQLQNAILVPGEALKVRDGKFYILAPNPANKEKPLEVDVKTGLSEGKKTEIVSGLQEGDLVLVPEFKSDGKRTANGSPFSPMGRPRGK